MKKISVNEITLVSFVVAIIFILGYLLTPIMGMAPIPAYRGIVVSPLYGIGIGMLLSKVSRFGIITMVGVIFGLLLSFFSPFMLFAPILAGVATDALCILSIKKYDNLVKRVFAASLFASLHIPIVMALMGVVLGGVFFEVLLNPLLVILPTLLSFVIAYIPAYYFLRIIDGTKALKKTNKIKRNFD